jgi:hypothetical protein
MPGLLDTFPMRGLYAFRLVSLREAGEFFTRASKLHDPQSHLSLFVWDLQHGLLSKHESTVPQVRE